MGSLKKPLVLVVPRYINESPPVRGSCHRVNNTQSCSDASPSPQKASPSPQKAPLPGVAQLGDSMHAITLARHGGWRLAPRGQIRVQPLEQGWGRRGDPWDPTTVEPDPGSAVAPNRSKSPARRAVGTVQEP